MSFWTIALAGFLGGFVGAIVADIIRRKKTKSD